MRVAFFLPNASDARYKKRINALEKNGVESTILAFKRNYIKFLERIKKCY